MPRTDLTVQTVPAFGGNLEDLSYTAADAANNMQFPHSGDDRMFVIVKNKHSSQQDVVLVSVGSNKTFQRTGDVTIETSAGSGADKESIQAIPPTGFTQTDGNVHLNIADDTALSLAVIRLVPTPP
jgi:hypothetical protein